MTETPLPFSQKIPGPDLAGLLGDAGFLVLGAVPEAVPGVEPGTVAGTVPAIGGKDARVHLTLIGSTGPGLWPVFRKSPEYLDDRPDPLDRYTDRVLRAIAERLACRVLFPFEGPPYLPFQQWAMQCGGFSQSPLGVLAHRTYGPWAGFRAAFLSAEPLCEPAPPSSDGPCHTCEDKPCLNVCPVGAVSLTEGYKVAACRSHLAESRDHGCWSGCLARRACPYGQQHRQAAETARFHMERFLFGLFS